MRDWIGEVFGRGPFFRALWTAIAIGALALGSYVSGYQNAKRILIDSCTR